ncbi:heavy-metal-associated domain-containing protein [Pollutimonas harenae]|uniref:Heavy-metal-associated domain-containing protein n=1 Tax=Pollutimonas harenae TaxID=657015 RepID=A0A853H149_9BURK|nr:heavy-metal-associated domain-containing protein [Pollutimonas harenae]NYT86032.1 heavy-metal-associated domain-containing protein [Pollutimonas harenae]TEA71080.1 copper chaperone [Pollutimonas harenae]
MLEFEIKDMTCGHCASTITKAVQAIAPGAELDIRLDNHHVQINGAPDADAIETAIREAGYSPVRLS